MAKKVKDPGLGYRSKKNAQRVVNSDGTSNVIHLHREKGIDDLYAYLIDISWFRFFVLTVLGYVLLNIVFWFAVCGNWY